MLKTYQQNPHHGGAPGYWEENWSGQRLEEGLRFCEVDPLRPLFERYTQPGSAMLEGGCGVGQYVAYYSARGVNIVGLDFARNTLARLRERDKGLVLCVGDVSALPFSDESFDVYYSGGVVEHFESGPEAALREAYRVSRPGGIFLISVPYFSPLRYALLPFKSKYWKRISRAEADAPQLNGGRSFFQYAYSRGEFTKLLAAAGFRVVSTRGYAITWGLKEIPFAERVMNAIENRRAASKQVWSNKKATSTALHGNNGRPSLLKRLIVSEDDRVPVAGFGVRALRWASSNMMMYVCERQ